MSVKSNFLSKGLSSVKEQYQKIKFGLFGTSLALPSLLISNCTGSCSNCYRCLVSGTPLVILLLLLIYRKISPKRYLKSKNIVVRSQ